MLRKFKMIKFIVLCGGFLMISCEKETGINEFTIEGNLTSSEENSESHIFVPEFKSTLRKNHFPALLFDKNSRNLLYKNTVEPSECSTTEYVRILLNYLGQIAMDPVAEDYFNLYINLSRHIAIQDEREQYFGKNGEYTRLVEKRVRELERFWEMPGELEVKGQHNESIEDREKLADVFYKLGMDGYSREMAYEAADEILTLNNLSPNLPESIFFSADGFLSNYRIIVIGDGLVQIISETGIEQEIVWTGVLAHEWAHQIQLNNEQWHTNSIFETPAENMRHLELEADFFAGYFMTHKRGATYNWKRIEGFFDLFFQLGDCGFQNSSHHGTPLQRMKAAKLGNNLADSTPKKGHILSPEEAHSYFMENLDLVVL